MVLLKSEAIQMGSSAPNFKLKDVEDHWVQLNDFKGKKALVVLFICNHCPYVQAIEDRLIQLRRDYESKGVQLIGICSNDASNYPEDAPPKLLKRWQEKHYGFPYLIDETQEVAKAYGAVCTPDLYVYDQDFKLAYHGCLDDSWQKPEEVKKRHLAEALDALLAGAKPASEQPASMGCSIKWKA
ncbi:MAG: thioredoxin family protein [Deltaproteobacteria bacterium]|nr:thioredoxin family protein [Deltaproteobacteria bacterium]